MSHDPDGFQAQFGFAPESAWKIGVERECFIVDTDGMPVPRAQDMLAILHARGDLPAYTFELSACQIESRSRPCELHELGAELARLELPIEETARSMGLHVSHMPVGPRDMPLDVYPDARYAELTRQMPREKLRAACRIIAVHLHVGMPDAGTALTVYNRIRGNMPGLCLLGDRSGGERLRIYRGFTPTFDPPHFADWDAFRRFAIEQGFAHDIRRWWSGIRISRHGTLEFRMFDATASAPEIVRWAYTVRALCKGAT